MKKHNRLVLSLVVAFCAINVNAAHFVISNDDDTSYVQPSKLSTEANIAARGITQVIPQLGQDGLIVTSLAATTSSNLLASRNYAMAGMFHVAVPEDRNVDPAAWYWIPSPDMQPYGLQWFDMITTTFKSWKGSTSFPDELSENENGHRIVVHVTGGYPVSAYTVTVSSSLTNIPATTFAIGTNTSNGTEIPFNQNFVGGNVGPNGTNESYWSTIAGQCVQQGDDTIFQVNELPSTNTYQWFARFGSTIVITVTSPGEAENIRKQFAMTNQWLRVELKKNGTVVATSYVESAKPVVRLVGINSDRSMVEFKVIGGQENSPYSLESCLDVTTLLWQPYLAGNFFNSGAGFGYPVEKGTHKRFFRAKSHW